MERVETILITGGAGFIGSNLCEYFVSKNYTVICFDNLITGKKSNITKLLSNPNFIFAEGDIRNFETCLEITKGVDVVLHQAALGSVPRSIENPVTTHEINSLGFLNVITAAKENKVGKFIYASSSSVYGDSTESPKSEENLGNPLSPYAISKLTNEWHGKLFHQLYGLKTIGLRYFNVFGKNQDPLGAYAAAIPRFIDAMIYGKEITIFGDGEQTRDFTYISNVIRANECAINSQNESSFGQAYNVACGKSFSVNEILKIIRHNLEQRHALSEKAITKNLPSRKGDIQNSFANISKIQRELDYKVVTHFEEGISEYIKHLLQKND